MAIKKYVANADTTIVNAYKTDMETRGTGSNMGAADIVEIFSVYGRQSTSSAELSRALVKFPIPTISADRTAGTIPGSGSVSFYLKMHSAPTSRTAPSGAYSMVIEPLSRDWQEGFGLDMAGYTDVTKGNVGANWMSASNTTAWTKIGGDYITDSNAAYPFEWYSVDMTTGLEDIEVDITGLVELWMAGTLNNYGVGVHLSGAYEASSSMPYVINSSGTPSGYTALFNPTGSTTSYYTRRFFARGSQYWFKRPTIEARWNSSRKDNRGEVFYSSSLAGVNDNQNTLFLYNYVRGRLKNIPSVGVNAIYVSLYSGSATNTAPSGSAISLPRTLPYTHVSALNPYVITGGWVATGIYSASFALTSGQEPGNNAPLTRVFDVWHDGTGYNTPGASAEFVTSSFEPQHFSASSYVPNPKYYMNITNLKDSYRTDETARLNLFVRHKNWSPTIYTVANAEVENTTIQSASYRVYRVLDDYEALPYRTGSQKASELSYDISGNYFDLDMNLLEGGYAYGIKFAFYDDDIKSWSEQPYVFKFRVEDYEY